MRPRAAKGITWGVYDLEWVPDTLEILLAGARDASGYQAFPDVASFLAWATRPEYEGRWLFAHAGGSYDVAFLLRYIVDNTEWRGEVAFSGSSAIAVTALVDGRKYHFGDSFALLKGKLARIGEIIGLPKLDMGSALAGSRAELVTYNERDCEIVWRALGRLEQDLEELGGALRPTLPSCGIALLRARFLLRELRTSPSINATARLAYYSSRVEPFRASCGRARYVDLNSSFPASAVESPLPGELTRCSARWDGSELALVECDVSVPRDEALPPLPLRRDGSVYHPVGSWSGWYSGTDLQWLEECGGKIERVRRAMHFEPWGAFGDMMRALYDYRMARRAAGDEVGDYTAKILLNGSYGKLAESPIKERALIRPEKLSPEAWRIAHGIWGEEERVELEHEHVMAAVTIVARSRRALGRALRGEGADHVYYCDTDSIVTDGPCAMTIGDGLGQWKVEAEIEEGRFAAPKLYALNVDNNWKVRGKGFPRLDYQGFCALMAGEKVQHEAFRRVKSVLRKGGVALETVAKAATLETRPKRAPLPGGRTRPWHVDELAEPWHVGE